MKYEQYISLIKELEAFAEQDRKGYERRVLGLAALGYAYFFGLILLFIAIPLSLLVLLFFAPQSLGRLLLFAIQFWWIVVPGVVVFFGFLGGAVRSLFTKFPEPEGREIKEADAPELFGFIRETTKALKAKLPDKVLITDEMNAAVVTIPRIGMFGRRVFLLLGIPIMKTLTPDQFKAVVAHEIGHISGRHGGFGKWAYQLRESWGRFIETQELNDHKFAFLYEKFVNWFFPYFQAYSFVLMREHEKEADSYAAGLVGARPLGEALLALETRGAELNNVFWKTIHEENLERSTPSVNVFSRMLGSLSFVDSDRDRDRETVLAAVKRPTDYNDSHPSLADRLKMLGYWKGEDLPPLPVTATVSASDHFLGERAAELIADFEQRWDEHIASTWADRHSHFESSRKRYDELEKKAAEGGSTAEEMLEMAGLLAERKGNLEALPLLRETVEKFPENAEAHYTLGSVLLMNDDESGLEHVRRSMELDIKWRYAASDIAFQFLRSKGRFEEAKEYAATVESQAEDFANAERERQSISVTDSFLGHEMTEEKVAEIVRKLQYYEEITALYLVRKVVKHFPDVPFDVLFIDIRERGLLNRSNDMKPEDLLSAVASRLENLEIGYFALLRGEFIPIKEVFPRIPNSQIFER